MLSVVFCGEMINRLSLLPVPGLPHVRATKEFFEPSEMDQPFMNDRISDPDDVCEVQVVTGASSSRNSTLITGPKSASKARRYSQSNCGVDKRKFRKSSASSSDSVKYERMVKKSRMVKKKLSSKYFKRVEDPLIPVYSADSYSSDDEQEPEWEVEKILTRRLIAGELKYKVKWVGYVEMTWEPLDCLTNCHDKLKEFLKQVEERKMRGLPGTPPPSDTEEPDEEADEGKDLGIDRVDLKTFAKLRIAPKYLNNHISKLPKPSGAQNLPEMYHELLSGQQLTNFMIDDVILIFIAELKLKRVGYISNFHFGTVYSNLGSPNDLVAECSEIAKHIHLHSINTANYVLVCCSTKDAKRESMNDNHFVLGVICKMSQKIIVLDSLRVRASSPEIEIKQINKIFCALGVIAVINFSLMGLTMDPDDWSFIYSTDCPQQSNDYDCGVFTIINALYILTNTRPPKDSLGNSISVLARSFIYSFRLKWDQVPLPQLSNTNLPDHKYTHAALKAAREFATGFESNFVLTRRIERKAASNILKSLVNQ